MQGLPEVAKHVSAAPDAGFDQRLALLRSVRENISKAETPLAKSLPSAQCEKRFPAIESNSHGERKLNQTVQDLYLYSKIDITTRPLTVTTHNPALVTLAPAQIDYISQNVHLR